VDLLYCLPLYGHQAYLHGGFWHTAEFHVAKLLAEKQPVTTGSSWPVFACNFCRVFFWLSKYLFLAENHRNTTQHIMPIKKPVAVPVS